MTRALVLLSLLLAACGGATLQTSGTTPQLVTVGGGQRTILTLTDVDDVRDVATGAGRVLVATDRGVLSYLSGADAAATRLTMEQGLPSDDVRAVAVDADGVALVATAAGLARVTEGTTVAPAGAAAPVGQVNDLSIAADGTVFACGSSGLARLVNGAWQGFGEPAFCTTLVTSTEGALFAATSSGLLQIEGDIVREHSESSAMPGGNVRGIAPLGPGKWLALLEGPSDTRIGYFDGSSWYGYTIDGFAPKVVGLALYRGIATLVTEAGTFTIRPAGLEEGVRLSPLSKSETHGVRSYRARTLDADAASARPPLENASVARPMTLATVPQNAATVEAPSFLIERATFPTAALPTRVFTSGDAMYLADSGRGVVELAGNGDARGLRTRDLAGGDLHIASDPSGTTWLVTKLGDLARLDGERLVRVAAPEGFRPYAIANGPMGAYVVGRVATPVAVATTRDRAARNARLAVAPAPPPPANAVTLRAYRVGPEGFTQLLERSVQIPEFTRVAMMAVDESESVWAVVSVEHDDEDGERTRGVLVMNPRSEAVVFHHRASDPAVDGEGSLQMPDEIANIDAGQDGYMWFSTLSGAVRIGNSQAIVFGEARGVRGEVVSDLAVGTNGRVWLAAAEGLGYYENQAFVFNLPGFPRATLVLGVGTDGAGHLWGAGPNGAVYYDGSTWTKLDEGSGLPTASFLDVEVDARDRPWFLGEDRVLVFVGAAPAATPTPTP